MEVMDSILQANPNIDAAFCGNDAMAMGAYQALVAAGNSEEAARAIEAAERERIATAATQQWN